MSLFSSNRGFRWWLYTASHSQFRLRSPKHKEEQENVDIVFLSVFYIDLPTTLRGVVVDIASNADIAMLTEKTGIAPDGYRNCFSLESGGKRYFVGAFSVRTSINTREYSDPGF